MNTKNLGMLALLAVLVIAVVFISGCVQPRPAQEEVTPRPAPPTPGPGEIPPTEQPPTPPVTPQPPPTPPVEELRGCQVGATVTIPGIGMQLRITGVERHTIEGKTMNLCCGLIQGPQVTVKHCADTFAENACYSISWMPWWPDGRYETREVMYPQPNNICTKEYDARGNLIADHGCRGRDWDCPGMPAGRGGGESGMPDDE